MPWFHTKQIERITVIETLFVEFQKRMDEHLNNEDQCFVEMKASMKDIIQHIDKAQQENDKSLLVLKADLVTMINREYASKIEVEKSLTQLRSSILVDIVQERKAALRELRMLGFGFFIAVSAGAWFYIHVIKGGNV